jgi:N-acetylglucosamine-6-phosphate deacetylase
MSVLGRVEGHVLTPQGFVHGFLEHQAGRVLRIEGERVSESRVRQEARAIVLPGFIDLHVHGGGGRDIMEGGDSACRWRAARQARHHGAAGHHDDGADRRPRGRCAPSARSAAARAPGAARVLGVHLEGPYINSGKLGAQPNFAKPCQSGRADGAARAGADQADHAGARSAGQLALIAPLRAAGFRVQIGHTLGSYEDGVGAGSAARGGFTHLFNAMTRLHHRDARHGGRGARACQYAEIIPDLLHVHPGAIRVALRSIPCLYLRHRFHRRHRHARRRIQARPAP